MVGCLRLKESGLDMTSEYPTIGNIIRGLVGSVLNRNISQNGQITYSLFNPSIADFVISEYFDRADYIAKLISCLRTTNALNNVDRLIKSNKTLLEFDTLLIRLFQYELDSILNPDLYSIKLIELVQGLEVGVDFLRLVKKLIDTYSNTLFERLGLPSIKIIRMAVEYDFISSNSLHIKEITKTSLKNAYSLIQIKPIQSY